MGAGDAQILLMEIGIQIALSIMLTFQCIRHLAKVTAATARHLESM